MSRIGRLCLIAVVASSGLLTAGAGPARGGTCPGDALCASSEVPGGGGFGVILPTKHKVSNALAHQMNNDASSIVNNTAFAAWLYDKKDGKGAKVCIAPGASENLSTVSFDNLASSSKVSKNGACPF